MQWLDYISNILCLVLGIVCGGGGKWMPLIVEWCKHRWSKQDKATATSADVRALVDAMAEGIRLLIVDRVTHIAECCVKDGKMTLAQKSMIGRLYKCHKSLGGNGDLDAIMDALDGLEVVA